MWIPHFLHSCQNLLCLFSLFNFFIYFAFWSQHPLLSILSLPLPHHPQSTSPLYWFIKGAGIPWASGKHGISNFPKIKHLPLYSGWTRQSLLCLFLFYNDHLVYVKIVFYYDFDLHFFETKDVCCFSLHILTCCSLGECLFPCHACFECFSSCLFWIPILPWMKAVHTFFFLQIDSALDQLYLQNLLSVLEPHYLTLALSVILDS